VKGATTVTKRLCQPFFGRAKSFGDYYGSTLSQLTYDTLNRLTGMVDAVGTTAYSYDGVGQLLSGDGPWPRDDVNYSYANRLRTRLTIQAPNASPWAQTNACDNEGELTSAMGKELNGVTPRWQEQFGYAYDGAGNLYQRTNYSLLQSFGVNNLNELTTLTNSGRLTVAGSTTSPATNVTVNTSNAVLYADASFASTNQSWVTGNNTYSAIARDIYGRSSTNSTTVNLQSTSGFTYDLNGNLLSDGTRYFAYNDENELISVWTAAWVKNFGYDGKMRRRIEADYIWTGSSWSLTNAIYFIYDGNVVIQERGFSSDIPLVTYTRGNDLSGTLQGAGGIGGLLARTDMGQWIGGSTFATAFYHADGNGNVTSLVYPNGSLAAKYLYDPFGNTLAQYGALAGVNNYRFSSQQWNANAGLYYCDHRFYDANLQKWLNRDPIGENGGLNLYGYVGNNPIDLIDPLGLVFYITVGFDGIIGTSIFGPNGLGLPYGFIASGVSVGINSDGQLFLQGYSSKMNGAVGFAGGGIGLNWGHSPCPNAAGISHSNGTHTDVDVGWEAMGGVSTDTDEDSFESNFPRLDFGTGGGWVIASGDSTTTTISTPPAVVAFPNGPDPNNYGGSNPPYSIP